MADDLQRLVLSHMDEVADTERADVLGEFHKAHVTDSRITVVTGEGRHGAQVVNVAVAAGLDIDDRRVIDGRVTVHRDVGNTV